MSHFPRSPGVMFLLCPMFLPLPLLSRLDLYHVGVSDGRSGPRVYFEQQGLGHVLYSKGVVLGFKGKEGLLAVSFCCSSITFLFQQIIISLLGSA